MSESFVDLVDLAAERLGAAVVDCNDEFFAPKENLIKQAPAIWREGEYTERGKWMDGWETRRRRSSTGLGPSDTDHDWCIIRLRVLGIVRGVDVDTSFFKGNYPASCALDALRQAQGKQDDWREVLPRTALKGDSHNLFPIAEAPIATHLRLRVFPDGGVARLRAYGEVVADWDRLRKRGDVDLAAVEHGGVVVGCSDMFFGSRHNLIMPGDATHMGDGWETKRRRGAGHDWTIVRLGAPGTIRRIEIDTRHFKGNAPGACDLEALRAFDQLRLPPSAVERRQAQGNALDESAWQTLLPKTPLQPHTRHAFEDEVCAIGDMTHVRFNIYPDGGVGRLRLYGRPA